jgi:hypothetical protein
LGQASPLGVLKSHIRGGKLGLGLLQRKLALGIGCLAPVVAVFLFSRGNFTRSIGAVFIRLDDLSCTCGQVSEDDLCLGADRPGSAADRAAERA